MIKEMQALIVYGAAEDRDKKCFVFKGGPGDGLTGQSVLGQGSTA